MSVDSFELALRGRMKAASAELDDAVLPAPPLWLVLREPTATGLGLDQRAIRRRFAAAVAIVMVVGVISGAVLLQRLPSAVPVASLAPSSTLASPTHASPALSTSPLPAASSGLPSAS